MRISDWSSDVCSSDLESAVELLETLLFGTRLLPLRFGYVAGHLPSDDAQHVQILPGKLPPDERPRQQYGPREPVKMNERNQCPGAVLFDHPGRKTELPSVLMLSPFLIKFDDPAAFLQRNHLPGVH